MLPYEPGSLVEVGRYEKLSDAREAALSLAAKDLAYSIDRIDSGWVINVDAPFAEIAKEEIESFAEEERARLDAPPAGSISEKVQFVPLFLVAWLLIGFFFLQQVRGEIWTRAGAAVSRSILQGEWWRTVTALMLHGDLAHLVANLAAGLLFASSLQSSLGTGLTWLLILLTGALGNFINAWGYRGELHTSIGASTAVFGALGLLVGVELWARWMHPHTRGRWSMIVPLGAGMALLAYLGVGSEQRQVDITAHLWGFAVGLPLGILAAAVRWSEKMPPWTQSAAGVITLIILGTAWWCVADQWGF